MAKITLDTDDAKVLNRLDRCIITVSLILEGGKMDIRTIEQVRNDLVEMAQELLFFAHISNMACTEEPIYKVAQRIRLNIGMLSKIIEEEQPKQPQTRVVVVVVAVAVTAIVRKLLLGKCRSGESDDLKMMLEHVGCSLATTQLK